MFSRIQAWNSYMIGLFIQKSHFHPYSIHSWFANGKTFCLLCLQVKIRKLTRDQLSSLVMKVDPSLTFLIFLVSTTTKYFPVCVPLVSYCDGLKSTISQNSLDLQLPSEYEGNVLFPVMDVGLSNLHPSSGIRLMMSYFLWVANSSSATNSTISVWKTARLETV